MPANGRWDLIRGLKGYCPLAPRRRSPDTYVWVKPKLRTHKECGAEVSSCAPHLLHSGLCDSPSRWCLVRVLCPVCVTLRSRGKKNLHWRWRHSVTPKHRHFCAKVHGFTFQKNVIMMTILPCCSMDNFFFTHCTMALLLTNSMHQAPSWEANRFAASHKFPAFYGTRRFITAFTRARHLSLSWASSIQSVPPHPTSWRSILILFVL